MADTGEARSTARSAVVRPLSRAAGRPCARPGCPSPARATLSFRYDTREAWLGGLTEDVVPSAYDLCGSHADKTKPPYGWAIVDQRPDEDEPASEAPRVDAAEIGGEQTVAVLAAALRSVPDPTPAPAPAQSLEAAVDHDVDTDATELSIEDIDVDADVRDALAELQSVLGKGRDDDLEPVLLDSSIEELVEVQEELEVLTEAVEELDHLDTPAPPAPQATPRPVPAASRDRDTAARHW